MNWIKLESKADVEQIIEYSFQKKLGVAIFKPSTRCSISAVAKKRLDDSWDFEAELPIYYLDLIQFRTLSDLIATKFNVQHESPQLLVIKNGKCIYNASHMAIAVKEIQKNLTL